jgi:hypothetical protein
MSKRFTSRAFEGDSPSVQRDLFVYWRVMLSVERGSSRKSNFTHWRLHEEVIASDSGFLA